jgi:NADH dehydrogenase (ubiquinone) 1 alpha/beta subcomplex 1
MNSGLARKVWQAVSCRVVTRMGVSQQTKWLAPLSIRGFADAALTKEQVQERVIQVVKNMDKVDEGKVGASSDFTKDLGLDSLDTVEVVMAFEEEFQLEIPDDDADKITSCAQAIDYIASHPMAK